MPIVGDVLAERYRLDSVLGVGGMASVFLATDLRLDRPVAVKVLVANLAADPQFAERFNREAGAMAGFSHPNVAAVYDVEPGDPGTGREPFYVMEYCEGGSLADRLRDSGRIAPAELVPIATAVSDGLAELHRHGLIHRDVKPANILFANERPKLADFGVAWAEGPRDGDPLTLPGTTVGTLPYMAPELVAGQPPSAASDVYALGVTIFQSLTGQFPQPASVAGVNGTESAPPLPVSAAAPDLGPRFDAALGTALAADPAARPAPVELAARLASGLETWGVARPNPGAVPAPPPSERGPSAIDLEAPTRVAPSVPPAVPVQAVPEDFAPPPPRPVVPEGGAARRPAAPRIAPSASRAADYRVPAIVATGLVVLALVAVLVLPRLLGAGGGLSGATPTASAGASATPPATALPSGLDTMLSALGKVDAAIEAARGGKDGLGGKDANELAQLASSVRAALDRGDVGAAATAAQALSDRADALAKGLDKRRRESLLAAIDDLLAALSAG